MDTVELIEKTFRLHLLDYQKEFIRKVCDSSMKKILLIARNDGQCSEWFRYLTKNIPEKILVKNTNRFSMDILTENCHIDIRPKSKNCYLGRRPNYHYAYGSEVNDYLLSKGSKRLTSLNDVISIIKGE